MSLFLKTIYSSLTGALGALVAWVVLDVALQIQPPDPYADALLNGALVGLFVGVAVNGFAGLMEFQVMPAVRGAAVGFAAGLFGGALGLLVGEFFYQNLGGSTLVRIAGWALFGLCLGLADGILARSLQRLIYAGIGGLLGGLLGGVTFSLVSGVSGLPNTSRALAFVLLGALVGFFIGLIPSVLKDAWLKVTTTGRNEGKERIIDKQSIVIGRASGCDLALYDDPGVADRHAEVAQSGGKYILRPVGGTAVLVNDRIVREHVLQNEDVFQVGSQMLIFRRRSEDQ